MNLICNSNEINRKALKYSLINPKFAQSCLPTHEFQKLINYRNLFPFRNTSPLKKFIFGFFYQAEAATGFRFGGGWNILGERPRRVGEAPQNPNKYSKFAIIFHKKIVKMHYFRQFSKNFKWPY